eukprot:1222415-Pleurochrysis_carterae.AAC.2
MPLPAAMDASARKEPHERASRRQLRAVDESPTAIRFMVGYFGPFGGRPALRVLGHRLLTRAR